MRPMIGHQGEVSDFLTPAGGRPTAIVARAIRVEKLGPSLYNTPKK